MEIARPFAQDMKLLKPSLTREFNQYVPFKVSFTLTVTVFIISTVLHLVFLYVYHRFNLKDRIFPKNTVKKNAIKPILHVPHECSPAVFEKLSKRYHLLLQKEKTAEILPLPPKKIIPEFHQQAASTSFAAPEPAYINDDRFFKKNRDPTGRALYNCRAKRRNPRLVDLTSHVNHYMKSLKSKLALLSK